MTVTAELDEPVSATRPIAPWWHTALLIAFFVLLAAAGAALQLRAAGTNLVAQRPNVSLLYLSLIAAEWGLARYVWKGGLSRAGLGLFTRGTPALDVLLGIGLWMLWKGIAFCWALGAGPSQAASISPLMPQGIEESVLWILLSIAAGISEELVFRGYLQHQLTALTGRTSIALVLQASIFGIAHGYQGLQSCLAIALYGALFTVLALWRKSLRPGMIAHAWTDIAAGLLR